MPLRSAHGWIKVTQIQRLERCIPENALTEIGHFPEVLSIPHASRHIYIKIINHRKEIFGIFKGRLTGFLKFFKHLGISLLELIETLHLIIQKSICRK